MIFFRYILVIFLIQLINVRVPLEFEKAYGSKFNTKNREKILYASDYENLQEALDDAEGGTLILDTSFILYDSCPVYIHSNTALLGTGVSKIFQPKIGQNVIYVYQDTDVVIRNVRVQGNGDFFVEYGRVG